MRRATFKHGHSVEYRHTQRFTHAWHVLDHEGGCVGAGASKSEALARHAAMRVYNKMPFTGGTWEVVEIKDAP